VHLAHWGFLTIIALYKSTYLLTLSCFAEVGYGHLLVDCVSVFGQVDLGDMENEVRSAEDSAKKAMADSQRLTEELRRQQDAATSSEKQRRTIEVQVRNVVCIHRLTVASCSGRLDVGQCNVKHFAALTVISPIWR